MEAPPPVCSLCVQNSASAFCLCDPSYPLLCASCLPSHTPASLHPTLPLPAYVHRSVPGYLDRVQTRIREIPEGCEELRKNVKRIDKCVRKLSQSAESVIASIREYVTSETEKLLRLRESLQADVETAIREVESTIFEDEPRLLHKLSPTLRTRGADVSTLSLFSYDITTTAQCIQLDFCLSLPDTLDRVLPIIHRNSLKKYNMETGETVSTQLSLSLSEYAVFCPTDSENVLGVGGYPSSSASYLLSLITGIVVPQHAMLTKRAFPGIIKQKSTVYVFGGLDGNTRTITASEKFEIGERVWKGVRSMKNPRCSFCPCEVGGLVYLLDAKAHKIIEVFNTATEEYHTLLIPHFPLLGNDSVAFIVNDELVMLTRNMQIGRWRFQTDSEFRVSTIKMNNNSSGSTNIPPVVVGREVFWVRWTDGVMVRFRVDGEEVVEECI